MEILNVYVGKELVKVDLGNLLGLDVAIWDKMTYAMAKKHQDLIPAIEIAIEDCLGTAVDIVDEVTFKLAIADLVNLINREQEELDMVDNTNKYQNPEEENNMGDIIDENGNIILEAVIDLVKEVAEDISDEAKQDAEKAAEEVQVKWAKLMWLLEKLGLTMAYRMANETIAAGVDANGNLVSFKAMLRKLEGVLQEEYKRVKYFSSQKTLAQRAALEAMLGDKYTDKNIIESLGAITLGAINDVTRWLQKKFDSAEAKAKNGAIKFIFRSIETINHWIAQGGKLIFKYVGKVVMVGVVAITGAIYWLYTVVRKGVTAMVNLVKGITNRFVDDDFEDFDEDYETVVDAPAVI